MIYFGFEPLCAEEQRKVRGSEAFVSFERRMLRACNVLLASSERELPVTLLLVDFSRGEVALKFNGRFTSDGMNGMMQWKDAQIVDMVSPIICSFINKATGYTEDAVSTKVKTLFLSRLLE